LPCYLQIIKGIGCKAAFLLLALVLGISAGIGSQERGIAAAADPGPDLVVQNIALSPQEPSLDDTVTIMVTVKNQGTQGASFSYAACYIDDTLLGSEYVVALGAGTLTTVSFTWEPQPGTHTIKAVADPGNSITETDETNNNKTYTFAPLASDLTIQSITWSPEEPSRGDNVVFSIVIKNKGNCQSGFTKLGFFIDGNSRGYQDIQGIKAGGTATVTYNWTAQTGQHPARAIIDEIGYVTESDESNNELTVTFSTLPPDLIIDAITWSPEHPSKSDIVTFTTTVKNQGSGDADSCNLVFYNRGTIQPSLQVSSLAAGASVNVTFTCKALYNSHDIEIVVDFYEKVTESDENNNVAKVTFVTMVPDFTVQNITWSPADAAVGDTVTFTVTFRNQGSGDAETSRAAFYLSGHYLGYISVPAIDADDEATGTFQWVAEGGTHIIYIVANYDEKVVESTIENNRFEKTIPIIPPDLIISNIEWTPENPAIGEDVVFTVIVENQGGGVAENFRVAYYIDDELITSGHVERVTASVSANTSYTWKSENGVHRFKAVVDYDKYIPETDETNNEHYVIITPLMPDLVIDVVTWSPTVINTGDEITFNVRIKNQGGLESEVSRVSYYVDGTLVGHKDIGKVYADSTLTEKFLWVATDGPHQIDIITDSNNQVVEIDEENNDKVVYLPPPDLVIQDITWSPTDAAIGDTVSLAVIVKNQGSGKTQGSLVTCYVDGLAIGSANLPGLDSGGLSTQTFNWAAESGTHSVMMVVDENNRVTETDETNNEKQINFATLTPELVIKDVTWFVKDPLVNDDVDFIVTIENQGSDTAGSSRLAYSIDDKTAVYKDVASIAAGDTVTIEFFSTLGAGEHTIDITIDADNDVTEIDETNNSETVPFMTMAPDLAVKSIAWSPLDASVGDNVTIKVEIENRGRDVALNSRLDVYVDGNSVGYAEIAKLESGNSVTRDFTWTAEAGMHEVEALVDMQELVLESNEINNVKSRSITLQEPEKPAGPATKISTSSPPERGFLEDIWWLILIAAALFGGIAFMIALKSFKKS